MTVYGIFGDVARTDADNIYGIYFSETKAIVELKYLNEMTNDTSFHIEQLEVE